MEYTIKVGELVDRPIIRDDQMNEWLNKMTDAEIKQFFDEIDKTLEEQGIENVFPTHNAEVLAKTIDRDILYNLFSSMLTEKHDKKTIFIGLTRLDLMRNKEDLSINDICLYDFKSSSLNKKDIFKADFIDFVDDDGSVKSLKHRTAVWPR